jgi:chemosensory pili system protein ChpC
VNVETEELYSLLVPLSEDRLILPRACVAEVVRYTQPVQQPGSQNWMLGTIGWNGRQLPVVAFEGTIGKDIPAPTGRTRVVVFYSSTGKIKTGYFGVLTQGSGPVPRQNDQRVSAGTGSRGAGGHDHRGIRTGLSGVPPGSVKKGAGRQQSRH